MNFTGQNFIVTNAVYRFIFSLKKKKTFCLKERNWKLLVLILLLLDNFVRLKEHFLKFIQTVIQNYAFSLIHVTIKNETGGFFCTVNMFSTWIKRGIHINFYIN